jgi:hypothetical protein
LTKAQQPTAHHRSKIAQDRNGNLKLVTPSCNIASSNKEKEKTPPTHPNKLVETKVLGGEVMLPIVLCMWSNNQIV